MLLVLFLWRTPTAGQEAVCSRAGGLTRRTQKAPGTQATCRTLRAGSQGPHGTRTFAQTNTALQRELIQGRVYLFLARRANAPSPLLCPRGAANEGNERRAERAGGGARPALREGALAQRLLRSSGTQTRTVVPWTG